MSNLTEDVYRVFDPDEPLPPEKQNLYVDLDDVRGQAGVVQRLANAIRRSDRPTCQLLAGHRGSGKTTELLRLRRELQTGPKSRYFTVFCEADNDVDRNDVDFPTCSRRSSARWPRNFAKEPRSNSNRDTSATAGSA